MICSVIVSLTLVLGILSPCFADTPAELANSGKYEEAVEGYKKAIAGEPDKARKAILLKELGDLFASREDYGNAADQYISSLACSRNFTEEERLYMATRISWGGKYSAAIRELRLILAGNAGNNEARIQLARTMAWSGDQKGAIEEAEQVLKNDPQNRDAMLVKANALKWQGRVDRALPIYQKLLKEQEEFDARLGFAYAQSASGNRTGARKSASLLKPEYPYQEKEIKELLDELSKTTRPHLDPWYGYYNDTDHNRRHRYGLHYGQPLGNWDLDFDFRHTDASDSTRHNWAEDFEVKGYSKITGFLGLGGGVGFSPVQGSGTNYFVTGNLRGDVTIPGGSIGLSLAREMFSDTAELIENRIRVNSAILSLSQRLTDRVSLFGQYSYRDYSDDNAANDFLFAPSYSFFTGNPSFAMGYRFRYMNYDRQSFGGYFDPNDYTSHQIFATFSYEKKAFSVYFEPYFGVQSFRRNGIDSSTDIVGGFSGALGYQLSKSLRIDVDGEFGNYAAQTASGYEYFYIGVRIGATF